MDRLKDLFRATEISADPRFSVSSFPATSLIEVLPGILAKFECNNPGGSHKTRAARYIVRSAVKSGIVIPGKTTVIEKTGGNFGFGLAAACAEIGVPVELAVGLGFSKIKRRCLEAFGARLIGVDMLLAGKTPREVVEWHIANAESLGRNYFYSDQFSNIGSVNAHEFETGPEVVKQLRSFTQLQKITFVACAGTGASLVGISKCLRKAGYDLEVVLVEPTGCDSRQGKFVEHKLEGMSVGVKPPFLDWDQIDDVAKVSLEEMLETQRGFAARSGYFVGNTAAACLHVAQSRAEPSSPWHKVFLIFYDHALWYLN